MATILVSSKRFLIAMASACAFMIGVVPATWSNGREAQYGDWANKDWPMVGGDWSNSRYSTLSQIAPNSIHKLRLAWVSERFADGSTSRSPLVVNNGMLFATAGRNVYALSATDGRVVWSYNSLSERPGGASSTPYSLASAVPNGKGVGVGGGMVYVGMRDGRVIALDQSSGELRWATQTGIDEPKMGQWAAVAPTYVDGLVLSGLSDGDHYQRGRMTALDAQTGVKRWERFTVPAPGEPGHDTWPSTNAAWRFGGGGVWTNPPVDLELGLAFFTAGNPVPAFAGDWRPGANLYTCSVLAVHLKTGEIKWHFQLVRHDVFEADVGIPIVLYNAVVSGRSRKALAVMRADGHMFQLDRRTGEPLFQIEERTVTQSETQRTWPTQPFQVGNESLLMTCEEWKNEPIPKGFTLGCMFTPPANPPPSRDAQNVLAPMAFAKAGLMAFSPKTRYFYAGGASMLHWPRRAEDPYFLGFPRIIPGVRSYAEFAAIDSATGKIVWRKREPTLEFLFGSPLVTATNLVFIGNAYGAFSAYDGRSGNRLWQVQLGTVAGPAATYQVRNEQYVAVAAGSVVWSFKLNGTVKLPEVKAPVVSAPEFPGVLVDTETIETTSLHRSVIEPGTRYFIDEFTFNPSRARVREGTKVLFVNNGKVRHEIAALDGSWSTGPLAPTEQAWLAFDAPGTHVYACKDHPWSYGQIVVVPAGLATASASQVGGDNEVERGRRKPSRGKEEFAKYCSSCHGENLEGHGPAPPLAGPAFISKWGGAKVRDLLNAVRSTMPQGRPASLGDGTYLAIVAYILGVNESTDEIPDDSTVLDRAIRPSQ